MSHSPKANMSPSTPDVPELKPSLSLRYDVYDDIPNVTSTLSNLTESTSLLSRNFNEAVTASMHSMTELSKFSISQLEQLSNQVNDVYAGAETATSQATIFLMKCAQLEKQLSRLCMFESQLIDVQKMLPTIEKLVAELPNKPSETYESSHNV